MAKAEKAEKATSAPAVKMVKVWSVILEYGKPDSPARKVDQFELVGASTGYDATFRAGMLANAKLGDCVVHNVRVSSYEAPDEEAGD